MSSMPSTDYGALWQRGLSSGFGMALSQRESARQDEELAMRQQGAALQRDMMRQQLIERQRESEEFLKSREADRRVWNALMNDVGQAAQAAGPQGGAGWQIPMAGAPQQAAPGPGFQPPMAYQPQATRPPSGPWYMGLDPETIMRASPGLQDWIRRDASNAGAFRQEVERARLQYETLKNGGMIRTVPTSIWDKWTTLIPDMQRDEDMPAEIRERLATKEDRIRNALVDKMTTRVLPDGSVVVDNNARARLLAMPVGALEELYERDRLVRLGEGVGLSPEESVRYGETGIRQIQINLARQAVKSPDNPQARAQVLTAISALPESVQGTLFTMWEATGRLPTPNAIVGMMDKAKAEEKKPTLAVFKQSQAELQNIYNGLRTKSPKHKDTAEALRRAQIAGAAYRAAELGNILSPGVVYLNDGLPNQRGFVTLVGVTEEGISIRQVVPEVFEEEKRMRQQGDATTKALREAASRIEELRRAWGEPDQPDQPDQPEQPGSATPPGGEYQPLPPAGAGVVRGPGSQAPGAAASPRGPMVNLTESVRERAATWFNLFARQNGRKPTPEEFEQYVRSIGGIAE